MIRMNMKKSIVIVIITTILIIIPISVVLANNISTKGMVLKDNSLPTGIYTKINMESKIIKNMGKNIEVKYSYSIDNIDVYKDNNEIEYLQKDEKNVGFIKPMNISEKSNVKYITKKVEKEEAKKIADKYIKDNVYEFEKYTFLNIDFNNEFNEYQVYYNKTISNYLTMDLIYITIDKEGNITSFLADKQGMFDKYKGIDINDNEVNIKINKEISEKYGEKLVNCVLQDKTLKIKNNKLVLECIVEINLKEGNQKFLDALDYYLE